MSLKRVVVTLVVLTGLGVAAWQGRNYFESRSQAAGAAKGQAKGQGGRGPAAARTVTVGMVRSELGQVRERLLLTGALKPKEQVDIAPKVTGRVQRLLVEVGDVVKAGQLVAELDNDELQQQVIRAEATIAVSKASLAQREAELRNAAVELERSEVLRKDGLISAQDVAARHTQVQVVSAQVELARAQQSQAEAELRELKIRLAQSQIFSPLSGHVAQRFVDEGALLTPNTPIVRIVNISTLVTEASVPERDVSKLRVGSEATVRVDAFGDEVFPGRIARVSPVLDPATRSALIQIEIANRSGQLRAEMFARVELNLASTRQAVLIPREGLVYRGQQPGVYVVEEGKPVFRAVETGLTAGESVEVLANLAPGTVIVGRGSSLIRQGDRVVPARGGEAPGPAQPGAAGRTEAAAGEAGSPPPKAPPSKSAPSSSVREPGQETQPPADARPVS